MSRICVVNPPLLPSVCDCYALSVPRKRFVCNTVPFHGRRTDPLRNPAHLPRAQAQSESPGRTGAQHEEGGLIASAEKKVCNTSPCRTVRKREYNKMCSSCRRGGCSISEEALALSHAHLLRGE